MKRPRIAGSREYQLAVDMNAEFKGAEKLDKGEVGEMFGDVEVDAELIFLLLSVIVIQIEDEAKVMFIEEVDFGFEVNGALGGAELF